jgi:hypothetical protein
MKNAVALFAAILLIVGSAAAQQTTRRSTNNRSTSNQTATPATTGSKVSGAAHTNQSAGLNTTLEQNSAGSTSGNVDNSNMPTTTDARSSTMTSAGPVRANKIKGRKNNTSQ